MPEPSPDASRAAPAAPGRNSLGAGHQPVGVLVAMFSAAAAPAAWQMQPALEVGGA